MQTMAAYFMLAQNIFIRCSNIAYCSHSHAHMCTANKLFFSIAWRLYAAATSRAASNYTTFACFNIFCNFLSVILSVLPFSSSCCPYLVPSRSFDSTYDITFISCNQNHRKVFWKFSLISERKENRQRWTQNLFAQQPK